eukprot:GEMP01026317.1.p1 GENE.GEMP01026317.1~~GEMP01026317.1.p1  ORF type:complete len:501 (+),score=121.41 GEMP01026317.1:53-1555(+)
MAPKRKISAGSKESSAKKKCIAVDDAGTKGKHVTPSAKSVGASTDTKGSKSKHAKSKDAKSNKSDTERKTGKYAVDTLVPNAAAYHVVGDFACTLNQTNIGDNNNKFYLIQLLQDSTHGKYATWKRWGRVGEPGQNNLSTFGADLSAAEKDFAKKFTDKTKNAWPIQGPFKAVQGKYNLVEMDAQQDESKEGAKNTGSEDAPDAPLGKLSEAQIHKGSAVLTHLDAILKSKAPPSAKVESMSGEFYSLIPHVFGRTRPPPINTPGLVEEKKALLDFYLRMGFSVIEVDNVTSSPIPGVLDGVAPATLSAAIGGRHLCSGSEIAMADKKGADCKHEKAGSPVVPMAAHLYAAIILYTGNAIYGDLNTSLRNKVASKCAAYKPYVRLLIDAARCLPAKANEVWRGISVDLFDEYTVGLEMTWWQVSSCTSDRDVAFGFARSCGSKSTLLTIRTKNARNISCVTLYPHEQENILLPGTQVRVISRERKGGMSLITLQETGSAL